MMHQFKRGSREPQETTLFDRYGPAIFEYLRLQTTSREDAEDLTVDVFTAALERDGLRGFGEREQLAWLRGVARHKLVDLYRRTHRRRFVVLEDVAETVCIQNEQSPEQLILHAEQLEEVNHAIDRLPTLLKQVVRLRYGADLSIAEISQLLKKSEPAVRQLLTRALSVLRMTCRFQQQEGGTIR